MDPDELFKRFFSGSFTGFGERRDGSDFWQGDDAWFGKKHNRAGSDMADELQRQMEEMDKQLKEVFRIFTSPEDEPSWPGIPALPDYEESDDTGHQPRSKSNPRDHMMKDEKAGSLPSPRAPRQHAFSSPEMNFGGVFIQTLDQLLKIPQWNRIQSEEKIDRDLDSKTPSGAEIADLFNKNEESSPSSSTQPGLAHPFAFRGNSISIHTVTRGDGTVEERRTVRDSNGHEETTVTRRKGPSSHTITTIKGNEGREERHETYNNIDKVEEFEKQWTGEQSPTEPTSSLHNAPHLRGILSDDTRGIFRKLFGF